MYKILNLGAGLIKPLSIENPEDTMLLNIDPGYHLGMCDDLKIAHLPNVGTYYLKHNAIELMEGLTFKVNKIVLYRYLEHVPRENLLYFIYLMSSVLKPGGIVEIIVPDYKILAKRILAEDPFSYGFDAEDIITTTEVVNEPGCPHASIWTTKRAEYYFGIEERFKVENIQTPFMFDGRNIYLYFTAKKI